eukprot:3426786-Pyramimonas_sp.AAC.1
MRYTATRDGCPPDAPQLSRQAGAPALGCFAWMADAGSRQTSAGGHPAREGRAVAWTNRSWNATWMCRQCLAHAWGAKPGAVNGLRDRGAHL